MSMAMAITYGGGRRRTGIRELVVADREEPEERRPALAADGEGRHIRMRPEREPWREK
jgi:hypothetical protein